LRTDPSKSVQVIGDYIFRFTGTGWEKVDLFAGQSEDWLINTLYYAPDGTPWVVGRYLPGWMAGDPIYRQDGERWQKMLGGGQDYQLAFSHDGKTVWAASSFDLHAYRDGKWENIPYPFETSLGIHLYDFLADAEDRLWMTFGGTGKSPTIHVYKDSQWAIIEDYDSFSLGNLWTDLVQGVWFTVESYTSAQSGVDLIHRVADAEVFKSRLPFDDISVASFTSFQRAQNGTLWLGGTGYNRWKPNGQPGLYIYSDGSWARSLMPADIPGASASSCAIDSGGDLFFSSDGKVVQREENKWTPMAMPEGFEYFSDLNNFNGELWARDTHRIYQYQNGNWISRFEVKENSVKLNKYFVDAKGGLWVAGSYASQVWLVDRLGAHAIPVPETEPMHPIAGFETDGQGNVYLAVQNNLYYWNGQDWRLFRKFDGIIQSLSVINNQIWVPVTAVKGGVEINWHEAGRWHTLDNPDLASSFLGWKEISGIYAIDHGANLLFAVQPAQGGVAYNLADGSFTWYTAKDGLADNEISDLCETDDGTLWFATGSGISRLIR